MSKNDDNKNKINVRKYTWVSESYGFGGYYEFEIEIPEHKEPIRRRYSEIEWLHQKLLLTSPGCKIPYLPEKNLWMNFFSHSDVVVKERKDQISNYLNTIMNHDKLSSNEFFQRFISKDFDKKQEIQEKRSFFSSAKQMLGFGGKNAPLYTKEKLYKEDDKRNLQRLAQGIKDILKALEDHHATMNQKNDAIYKIREISKNMQKFSYSNKALDLENSQNYEDNKKIYETNSQYLKDIEDIQKDYLVALNHEIKKIQVS